MVSESSRRRVLVSSLIAACMGLGVEASAQPFLRFKAEKVDDFAAPTSLAWGPDGNLYASDLQSNIYRFQIDPATGLSSRSELLHASPGNQHNLSLAFDPGSTANDLKLWTAPFEVGGQRASTFTGEVRRLSLPAAGSGDPVQSQTFITGLPHDGRDFPDHTPHGIDFGPDGKLYLSTGGVATLGGSQNWDVPESPLSAAILAADVNDPGFLGGGNQPVDVTADPNDGQPDYDPTGPGAKVQIFATGFRNAFDIAWHSNGELYAGDNANSVPSAHTPDNPDTPVNEAVQALPDEQLALVREGKYYGHPNPSRGEFILNGGNPTGGDDSWEVEGYPVGVEPEPNFDPSLIFNTRDLGLRSPNGITEYRGPGELNGRLLVANFSGNEVIQSFELGADGRVTRTDRLQTAGGSDLTFNGTLDVVQDAETGRIYVAAFGSRNQGGSDGAIWRLQPITKGVAPVENKLLLNPSFEQPDAGKIDDGFAEVPGWADGGSTYTDSGVEPDGAVDGQFRAFLRSSDDSLIQTVHGFSASEGQTIALSFWLMDTFQAMTLEASLFYVDDAGDRIPFASDTFSPLSDWILERMEGVVPAEAAGRPIGVQFDHVGAGDDHWLGLDDVALAPEPGSMALLAMGSLFTAGWRRRR